MSEICDADARPGCARNRGVRRNRTISVTSYRPNTHHISLNKKKLREIYFFARGMQIALEMAAHHFTSSVCRRAIQV